MRSVKRNQQGVKTDGSVSINYESLFEALLGNSLLLQTNAPLYTILAVTKGMMLHSGLSKEALINQPFFEPFPVNTSTTESKTLIRNVMVDSFHFVTTNKKGHTLPVIRYDLEMDGILSELYWSMSNQPVLDNNGEVEFILHTVENITEQIKAKNLHQKIIDTEPSHHQLSQAPVLGIVSPNNNERKNVEQALKESKERFQAAIDATHGIVWTNNNKGEMEGEQVGWATLTGQSFKEYQGYGWSDVVHPEDAQPTINLWNEAVAQVKTFEFEHRVKVKNNGYRMFSIRAIPLVNTDGTIREWVGVHTDITEQKRSEAALKQSEQQVRSLIESAPFPIGVYVGKEMRIELANQAIIDVFGKGDQVIGKLYSEILPELDNQSIFKQLDDVYTTGIPHHAKNQRVDIVVAGKMKSFYFNYSFMPLFDASGRVYGVMNTAADVTDLNLAKQALEQSGQNLRNTILQSPVAMCIFRSEKFIVEIANERMLELWRKTGNEVMNKPIFEGLPEAKDQGLEELLHQVYETGQPFKAFEMPIVLPHLGKMETTYINFVYEPLREAGGIITGIIAVAIEVKEQVLARRKIEEVVAQRTKELAEINEALMLSNSELSTSNQNLEEFAYAASHDLKEPIRKIHFFGDRLKNSLEGRMTEEERMAFERMEMASKRMGALIDDLLSFSQVSLRPQAFENVDMNALLQVVLDDLDLEIENKKATIKIDKLFTIRGHHRQLQQAFQNLIANSLKYSKTDIPPVIQISCHNITGKDSGLPLSKEEMQKHFYVITVQDNGIGFDQKDAEKIFNVFTRLHGNAEYKGTGVGLSIVRKVIKNHSGYITASSNPGEGAAFHIYFPHL